MIMTTITIVIYGKKTIIITVKIIIITSTSYLYRGGKLVIPPLWALQSLSYLLRSASGAKTWSMIIYPPFGGPW